MDTTNSSDAETTPESLATGNRSLAAIVFTDTVGFSAMMSRNEEHTLQAVGQDLVYMRTICENFGGQVLKSTGDGLLMLFTSAVQAVACSLEIQRQIHKRNLEVPQADRVCHRIGIHLGDVFQQGGDVMGDGVNIAARLQTQAVPGGICMSNTVFDVVNNRLPFYVNDLGARKLKNIGMVTAYQISPMESQPTGFRIGWYRYRPWVWRFVWLALILLIVGYAYHLGVSQLQKQKQRKAAQLHQPIAPSTSNSSVSAIQPGNHAPSTPTTSPIIESPAQAKPLTEASQTEFELARFNDMRTYDFDGMQNWIATHDWPGKDASQLGAACGQLRHLFNWTYGEFNKHSAANPLIITGKLKTLALWPAPFDGVIIKTDNQQRTVSRGQVAPLLMVGIVSQLIKEGTFSDLTQKQQLQRELQLFIKTYHITLPAKPAATSSSTTAATPAPNQ